jgi:hypothetical protein
LGPKALSTRGSLKRISPMGPRLSTRILAVSLADCSLACLKPRTSSSVHQATPIVASTSSGVLSQQHQRGCMRSRLALAPTSTMTANYSAVKGRVGCQVAGTLPEPLGRLCEPKLDPLLLGVAPTGPRRALTPPDTTF